MVDRSDQEKEAMQRKDAVLRTSFQRIYSKVAKTDDHDRQDDAYDDDLPNKKNNLEVYVYRRRTIILCNGDWRVRQAPCLFWGFGPDFCFYIHPYSCNDINSLNTKLRDVLVGQLGLKLGEKEIADVACGFKSHVLNDGDGPEMMRTVVVAEFLNEEECYLTCGVGSVEEEEDSELDEEENVLESNSHSDSDKEDDDSDSDEEDEEEGDLEPNSHLEEEEHDLVANSHSNSVEDEHDLVANSHSNSVEEEHDSDSSSDSEPEEEESGSDSDSDEEEDDSESEDDDDEVAEARMRRMPRVWQMDTDCTTICAVCLDEFDCEVEDVVMTYCWHLFHDLCLRKWLRKKKRNGCPMCRTPFHS